MKAVLTILAAYLLGSIPFGYLIVRLRAGADVRETGSGGTGATNVSRRAGKAAGVVTLVLDAAKGAAAVLLASCILGTQHSINWLTAAASVTAIVGHCFPIWLGFRGGKGVATGVGVFLMLGPLAVAGAAVLFLLTVLLTRYVSLGSIIATASIPMLVEVQNAFVRPVAGIQFVLVAAIVGGLLIIFMHRANIGRLLHGTESRFR
jgi:acyl phosphate:glycerol-3-phosphate acyltransferase